MRPAPAPLAAVLCALSACSHPDGVPTVQVVDSAGVAISTSTLSSIPTTTPTSLALTLGTISTGGPTDFFRVRDIEIVDSTDLVVANGGSEQVRVFRTDGTFVSEFGREGHGPREFRGLSMVEQAGDSVVTYDGRNDRITLRSIDGTFLRSYRLQWVSGALVPADLSVLDRTVAVTARYMTELSGTGLVVDTGLVSLYDNEGRLIDSIARLPHNTRFVRQDGDRRTTVGAPFVPSAGLVGWAGGFCYAFGPAAEVRCFDPEGALREIWRVEGGRRAVEDHHRSAYWTEIEESANEAYRRAVHHVREDLPFPAEFPAFSRLVADDQANLWARRYRLPGESVDEWWVFSGGRLSERVTLPSGFELMDVESGLLAGVWRDDLGVEHVQVYARGAS